MKAVNIVLLALGAAAYANLATAGQVYQDQVTFNDGSQLNVNFTFDATSDSISNISGGIISPGIVPGAQTVGADDFSRYSKYGTTATFTVGGNTYLQVDWFSSQAQINAGTYTYDVTDVYLLSNGSLSYVNAPDPNALVANLYGDGVSFPYQAFVSSITQESLTAIPLPASLALIGAGLPGLLGFGVSRRKMPQALRI